MGQELSPEMRAKILCVLHCVHDLANELSPDVVEMDVAVGEDEQNKGKDFVPSARSDFFDKMYIQCAIYNCTTLLRRALNLCNDVIEINVNAQAKYLIQELTKTLNLSALNRSDSVECQDLLKQLEQKLVV